MILKNSIESGLILNSDRYIWMLTELLDLGKKKKKKTFTLPKP